MARQERIQEVVELYAALMTEVKVRFFWIDYAANGKTGMPGQMVDEFAHLQLRMICELVALACLVAHHDIEATRNAKLQSAFAADWLLKSLEELNPGCFPGPVVKANTLPGEPHHFVERGPDFMTRDELLKLYSRECGRVLHRGSLKNLLKTNSTVQKTFPQILGTAQRLANLLSVHHIGIGNDQYLCLLGGFQEAVRVIYAKGDARPAAIKDI